MITIKTQDKINKLENNIQKALKLAETANVHKFRSLVWYASLLTKKIRDLKYKQTN